MIRGRKMSPSWRPAKLKGSMSLSTRMFLSKRRKSKPRYPELDERFPIINFASCTSDELFDFMLDFFDLTDEEELLHFCIIYFTAAAAEAKEAEVAEIAA